jgi:hypothetical protein
MIRIKSGTGEYKKVNDTVGATEAESYLQHHGLRSLDYLSLDSAKGEVQIKTSYGHKVVITYDPVNRNFAVTLC